MQHTLIERLNFCENAVLKVECYNLNKQKTLVKSCNELKQQLTTKINKNVAKI